MNSLSTAILFIVARARSSTIRLKIYYHRIRRYFINRQNTIRTIRDRTYRSDSQPEGRQIINRHREIFYLIQRKRAKLTNNNVVHAVCV